MVTVTASSFWVLQRSFLPSILFIRRVRTTFQGLGFKGRLGFSRIASIRIPQTKGSRVLVGELTTGNMVTGWQSGCRNLGA